MAATAAVENDASSPGEARLIVGVDYGTTYSGVAWGHTGSKSIESISVINSWPGKGATNESKTPSAIAYGTGTEFPEGFRWGSDIPTGVPRNVWVKLLLNSPTIKQNVPDSDPTSHTKTKLVSPAGFGTLPPGGKGAVDVVSDYLSGLYRHTLAKLALNYGQEYVDVTPIEFVLTVPAIWSDKARSLTKEAATRAGFGSRADDRMRMVSEPEAAAIYTIKSTFDSGKGTIKRLSLGECFVMCDAGGGTVDLISYEVVQVEPELKIAEIVVGSGGNCGSTFIDSNFQKLLERRLGPALQRIKMDKRGPGSKLMNEFELVKRDYGSGNGSTKPRYLTLNVADNAAAGIEDGEFELSEAELRETFTPVVADIIKLIEEQVSGVQRQGGKIKHILLVGGFGESDYILTCLREHVWGPFGKIEIIRPESAWSAVSRGAVLWGLVGDLVVDKRRCRRHYGTELLKHFDPNIHNEIDAMTSTFTNLKMARNQVSWIINRGDKTDSEIRFKLSCVTSFHKGEKLIHTTQLVACDVDEAPTHLKDKDVYDLCLLTADLSGVPEGEFDECLIGNKTFLRAEFSIELTFLSADIKFETWFKGKCYGAVKTKY